MGSHVPPPSVSTLGSRSRHRSICSANLVPDFDESGNVLREIELGVSGDEHRWMLDAFYAYFLSRFYLSLFYFLDIFMHIY